MPLTELILQQELLDELKSSGLNKLRETIEGCPTKFMSPLLNCKINEFQRLKESEKLSNK
jgi:hypothetical protein